MALTLIFKNLGTRKDEKGAWFEGHSYYLSKPSRRFLSFTDLAALQETCTETADVIPKSEIAKVLKALRPDMVTLCMEFDTAAPEYHMMELVDIYNRTEPRCVFSNGRRMEMLTEEEIRNRLTLPGKDSFCSLDSFRSLYSDKTLFAALKKVAEYRQKHNPPTALVTVSGNTNPFWGSG